MEEVYLFKLRIYRWDRTKMHEWLDYNCPSWDYSVDPDRTGLNQRLPKDPAIRDPFYAVLKKTQDVALGYPNKPLMAHVRIIINKHDSIILQMFHDVVLITSPPGHIPMYLKDVVARRTKPMVL